MKARTSGVRDRIDVADSMFNLAPPSVLLNSVRAIALTSANAVLGMIIVFRSERVKSQIECIKAVGSFLTTANKPTVSETRACHGSEDSMSPTICKTIVKAGN